MLQVVFFVLAVLLANVGGHAACRPYQYYGESGHTASSCSQLLTTDRYKLVRCEWNSCPSNYGNECYLYPQGYGGELRCNPARYIQAGGYWSNCVICDDECEVTGTCPTSSSSQPPPSSSSSPPGPPLGGGCGFCQDTVDYGAFPPQVKHVVWHCDSCTAGRDGIANEAAGCSIESIGPGSCEANNECPSGVICMDDSTFNYDCYATIGSNVYVRNRKTGNVFACEADGSCDMALRKVANGECIDPSQPPEEPNPDSSGSGDSSSSEEPPESSSGESQGPWGLEKTSQLIAANTQKIAENTGDIANYTQEIMNKSIDLYNQQTEMQIDLSHVRTNTENTATTTGNIDTKLSTTNNLLNDIKNKNWSPQIHVGSPDVNVEVQGDTNIITVNADTSHSPFEILNFLRSLFSDTSGGMNANDTLGTGSKIDSLTGLIDGLSNDTIPNMGDSVPGAVLSFKTTANAMKDSIVSITRDSVNSWNNKLLNNGTLSGSGSDACPSPFTRIVDLNIGPIQTQIGPLGYWLCQPIPGAGVTWWALCRVLLRACVAISCMWWIYKEAVIGGGGSSEED